MASSSYFSDGAKTFTYVNQKDFDEILKVQQLMSQRLMQEQKTDHKIDVLNIIQDLTENGKKPVQTEAVLLEVQINGIEAQEAQDIIDDLIQDNLLKRPRTGYLQVT